jgi:hypothetical protein
MIYNISKSQDLIHRWEGIMFDSSLPIKEKKIYTKPLLTEVHLVAEEAVLSVCKVNGGVLATCNPPNPSCAIASSGS